LAAADAVSFDDGLRMVQMRVASCRKLDATTAAWRPSSMDDAALAEVCREADVDIANINCPGQVVIPVTRKNCEGHRSLRRKRALSGPSRLLSRARITRA